MLATGSRKLQSAIFANYRRKPRMMYTEYLFIITYIADSIITHIIIQTSDYKSKSVYAKITNPLWSILPTTQTNENKLNKNKLDFRLSEGKEDRQTDREV